jgi:hypothetical protein
MCSAPSADTSRAFSRVEKKNWPRSTSSLPAVYMLNQLS